MSLGSSSLMSTTVRALRSCRCHRHARECRRRPRRPPTRRRWSRRGSSVKVSSNSFRPTPGLRTLRLGVAVALFGGEQGAVAIHFDAAGLRAERASVRLRMEQPLPEPLGRRLRHAAVPCASRDIWPGVEMEMHDGGFEPAATLRRTNTGPLSRVQPRLVGCTMNSTPEASTPARSDTAGQFLFAAGVWTNMRMASPGATLRTISV